MSTFITEKELKEFEAQEELWLSDEGMFDAFWDKKLEDEQLFFSWLVERFERTANHFLSLTGLTGQFHHKLVTMLNEAAMVGYFFGELRWNRDIRGLVEGALSDRQEE